LGVRIARGDVFDADIPTAGPHPVVVVTREEAIEVLSSVTVVLVTSTLRGHVAEVRVGAREGLDRESAVNCDNVFTLSKRRLSRYRGSLGPDKLRELNESLRIALGLDS
jgi:mRNA interferase MazF